MRKSLILLSHLVLSAQSAPTPYSNTSVSHEDLSETLYDNLELLAQYAGAAYCVNEEGSSAANTTITCLKGVCPEVESAKAYSTDHFSASSTSQDGYLAIDPTNNLIIVSFRGTNDVLNLIDDAEFTQTSCSFGGSDCGVETGFSKNWKSVQGAVTTAVKSAVASFPSYKLVITGHSLGGAVATIAGATLRDAGIPCDIYTYGSPRVFNAAGADYVSAQAGGTYRVTHFDDLVPRIPGIDMAGGYAHTSPEYWLAGGSATTNDYPISAIKVCTGDKNLTCNGQYNDLLDPDITAHGHYFGNISACGPFQW